MIEVVVIGAGKFAVEIGRYIDQITAAGPREYRVGCHLVVGDEAVHVTGTKVMALAEFDPPPGTRVVLAVSEVERRRELIDGLLAAHALVPDNLVHPTAIVDPEGLAGGGNIIGPNCYLGAGVTLGSHNVINYHCTIGHHSRFGSNNFIAPNFNSGNSIELGDDNFFGVSCTVGPEVVVGSNCRFQAGITVMENARSGHSYLSPNRIRSIKSFEGATK